MFYHSGVNRVTLTDNASIGSLMHVRFGSHSHGLTLIPNLSLRNFFLIRDKTYGLLSGEEVDAVPNNSPCRFCENAKL